MTGTCWKIGCFQPATWHMRFTACSAGPAKCSRGKGEFTFGWCDDHARECISKPAEGWNCGLSGCGGKMNFLDATPFYEVHREKWITEGGLAAKDEMLDCVTLEVPAGWDTWGSLLSADPPSPAPSFGVMGYLKFFGQVMIPVLIGCGIVGLLVGFITLIASIAH